jgi:hypothetical protein
MNKIMRNMNDEKEFKNRSSKWYIYIQNVNLEVTVRFTSWFSSLLILCLLLRLFFLQLELLKGCGGCFIIVACYC